MILKESVLFTKKECEIIINEYPVNKISRKMTDRDFHSYSIDYSLDNKWIFDKLKSLVIV
jgi:hypothetical protein